MINLKQSGFGTTYSFKILLSERQYKNNLKNREAQKDFLQFSCNVYVMFYFEILQFCQDFENENLCFF